MTLAKEDYIRISQELFKLADTARQPIENIWDENWRLYNNDYDWSQKAEWQSKVPIPKFAEAVEIAAATFKRALVNTPEFFTVEGIEESDKEKALYITKLVQIWLEKEHFYAKFPDSVKAALLSNLIIFKVYWEIRTEEELVWPEPNSEEYLLAMAFDQPLPEPTWQEVERGRLRIVPVDPYKFWIDPSGLNKFVCEKTKVDLADLKDMAEVDDAWDKEEVARIEESFHRAEEEYREAVRRGETDVTPPPYRKEVELLEFWGDICDNEGNLVHRNVTWVVANGQYLVKPPQKNPYWHRKPPYVWGPLISKPFSNYHKSMLEDAIGIQKLLTEFANLLVDANTYSTAKAYEVDVDQVVDPTELKNGIYPGKVFKKRGSATFNNMPMIREIDVGGPDQSQAALYAMFDREFQGATGVTELMAGLPGLKGTPTATEVAERSAQSGSLFDAIARNVEEWVIEPLIERVYMLLLQYMDDFEEPIVRRVLGPDKALALQQATRQERYEMIKGNYDFRARGISVYLSKQQELEKIIAFTRIMGRYPMLMQAVNIPHLLKKAVEALNWDPSEVLFMPENNPKTQLLGPDGRPIEIPQMNPQQQIQLQAMQMLGKNGQGGGMQTATQLPVQR